MKWPETLTLVRHGESAYNELRALKEADPLFAEFKKAYNRRRRDPERAQELALELVHEGSFILKSGDHDTGLTQTGQQQAQTMATRLHEIIKLPDVIFVSPYDRAHHTLHHMTIGWPELADVPVVEEERIREQEHGLALLYNDWRIFQTLYPEQEQLRARQGSYWYRYPQGENVPDVRERLRSWTTTLTRDYAERNLLAVTHHLTILGFRANLERLDAAQFIDLDEHDKPINCGATVYRGDPSQGRDGRLMLDVYNAKLY